MRKFCGKTQSPHSFGRIVRNYAETVPFHKIYTPVILDEITVFFIVGTSANINLLRKELMVKCHITIFSWFSIV